MIKEFFISESDLDTLIMEHVLLFGNICHLMNNSNFSSYSKLINEHSSFKLRDKWGYTESISSSNKTTLLNDLGFFTSLIEDKFKFYNKLHEADYIIPQLFEMTCEITSELESGPLAVPDHQLQIQHGQLDQSLYMRLRLSEYEGWKNDSATARYIFDELEANKEF